MMAHFFDNNLWINLSSIGENIQTISVLEKIIRPVLVYIFLVIVLRLFGKRELAQLNPFDLIVLLTLSNTLQNAIIGSDNSVSGGFIGAFTLLSFNYVVVRFLFRHRRLDQLLTARSVDLIRDGEPLHKEMAREFITKTELLATIRRQGFHHIKDVKKCVLDENGTFYVEGKAPPEDEVRHGEVLDEIKEVLSKIKELEEQIKLLNGKLT